MAKTIAGASRGGAANLPRLAVPPVRLSGGADTREADALAQILAAHLVQSGKYAVYPRTKGLEQVQAEIGNQFGGDVADEYLPQAGRGNNPRLALSVTARKLGGDTMFNAAVINLETGVQEAGETADYRGLEDGIRAMQELAWRLTGQSTFAVNDAASFAGAIEFINRGGAGGSYTITLTGSFFSDPVSFSNGSAKTITLRGEGRERIISSKANKPLFTVPGTITLVLDNNLTLNGNNKKARLVRLEGGALVMKAGATLRGSTGGGVSVASGGSFTMNGGTISGNSASYYGGGVYVGRGNRFVKTGGTIDGTNRANTGRAVYVSDGRVRNPAAGPGVNLDSSISGRAGGWE
jgi:hypothetical protein